jgi:hypothetical protein
MTVSVPHSPNLRALPTSPVLGEILSTQLREAAWSLMVRDQLLKDPTTAVSALLRRENFLRGHLAGIASVLSQRLVTRLVALLHNTDELGSEACVAALLLLRCKRAEHEKTVVTAWRDATCPAIKKEIGRAITHAGVHEAAHQHIFAQALVSDDAACSEAATEIFCRRPMPLGTVAQQLRARRTTQHFSLQMLRLMAAGAWPLEPRRLVDALAQADAEMRHAVDRVLAAFAPTLLAARARAALYAGESPGLLGLEACASEMVVGDPQGERDFQALGHLMGRGRLGPLAMGALGLSGYMRAAEAALEQIGTAQSAALTDAALETFAAITGIAATDGPLNVAAAGHPGPRLAGDLRGAMATLRVSTAREQRLVFGQPQSTQAMLSAWPHMQLGRWQSYGRLCAARTQGSAGWAPWAFLATQREAALIGATAIDSAFAACAQGVPPSPLAATLTHLMHPPQRSRPTHLAQALA